MNKAASEITRLTAALAEAEGRAAKAAALNAYFVDCCEYHDSYGVEDSGFVTSGDHPAGSAIGAVR